MLDDDGAWAGAPGSPAHPDWTRASACADAASPDAHPDDRRRRALARAASALEWESMDGAQRRQVTANKVRARKQREKGARRAARGDDGAPDPRTRGRRRSADDVAQRREQMERERAAADAARAASAAALADLRESDRIGRRDLMRDGYGPGADPASAGPPPPPGAVPGPRWPPLGSTWVPLTRRVYPTCESALARGLVGAMCKRRTTRVQPASLIADPAAAETHLRRYVLDAGGGGGAFAHWAAWRADRVADARARVYPPPDHAFPMRLRIPPPAPRGRDGGGGGGGAEPHWQDGPCPPSGLWPAGVDARRLAETGTVAVRFGPDPHAADARAVAAGCALPFWRAVGRWMVRFELKGDGARLNGLYAASYLDDAAMSHALDSHTDWAEATWERARAAGLSWWRPGDCDPDAGVCRCAANPARAAIAWHAYRRCVVDMCHIVASARSPAAEYRQTGARARIWLHRAAATQRAMWADPARAAFERDAGGGRMPYHCSPHDDAPLISTRRFWVQQRPTPWQSLWGAASTTGAAFDAYGGDAGPWCARVTRLLRVSGPGGGPTADPMAAALACSWAEWKPPPGARIWWPLADGGAEPSPEASALLLLVNYSLVAQRAAREASLREGGRSPAARTLADAAHGAWCLRAACVPAAVALGCAGAGPPSANPRADGTDAGLSLSGRVDRAAYWPCLSLVPRADEQQELLKALPRVLTTPIEQKNDIMDPAALLMLKCLPYRSYSRDMLSDNALPWLRSCRRTRQFFPQWLWHGLYGAYAESAPPEWGSEMARMCALWRARDALRDADWWAVELQRAQRAEGSGANMLCVLATRRALLAQLSAQPEVAARYAAPAMHLDRLADETVAVWERLRAAVSLAGARACAAPADVARALLRPVWGEARTYRVETRTDAKLVERAGTRGVLGQLKHGASCVVRTVCTAWFRWRTEALPMLRESRASGDGGGGVSPATVVALRGRVHSIMRDVMCPRELGAHMRAVFVAPDRAPSWEGVAALDGAMRARMRPPSTAHGEAVNALVERVTRAGALWPALRLLTDARLGGAAPQSVGAWCAVARCRRRWPGSPWHPLGGFNPKERDWLWARLARGPSALRDAALLDQFLHAVSGRLRVRCVYLGDARARAVWHAVARSSLARWAPETALRPVPVGPSYGVAFGARVARFLGCPEPPPRRAHLRLPLLDLSAVAPQCETGFIFSARCCQRRMRQDKHTQTRHSLDYGEPTCARNAKACTNGDFLTRVTSRQQHFGHANTARAPLIWRAHAACVPGAPCRGGLVGVDGSACYALALGLKPPGPARYDAGPGSEWAAAAWAPGGGGAAVLAEAADAVERGALHPERYGQLARAARALAAYAHCRTRQVAYEQQPVDEEERAFRRGGSHRDLGWLAALRSVRRAWAGAPRPDPTAAMPFVDAPEVYADGPRNAPFVSSIWVCEYAITLQRTRASGAVSTPAASAVGPGDTPPERGGVDLPPAGAAAAWSATAPGAPAPATPAWCDDGTGRPDGGGPRGQYGAFDQLLGAFAADRYLNRVLGVTGRILMDGMRARVALSAEAAADKCADALLSHPCSRQRCVSYDTLGHRLTLVNLRTGEAEVRERCARCGAPYRPDLPCAVGWRRGVRVCARCAARDAFSPAAAYRRCAEDMCARRSTDGMPLLPVLCHTSEPLEWRPPAGAASPAGGGWDAAAERLAAGTPPQLEGRDIAPLSRALVRVWYCSYHHGAAERAATRGADAAELQRKMSARTMNRRLNPKQHAPMRARAWGAGPLPDAGGQVSGRSARRQASRSRRAYANRKRRSGR